MSVMLFFKGVIQWHGVVMNVSILTSRHVSNVRHGVVMNGSILTSRHVSNVRHGVVMNVSILTSRHVTSVCVCVGVCVCVDGDDGPSAVDESPTRLYTWLPLVGARVAVLGTRADSVNSHDRHRVNFGWGEGIGGFINALP